MFKVGDNVVCINAKQRLKDARPAPLIEGKIYTVLDIKKYECCGIICIYVGILGHTNILACKCGIDEHASGYEWWHGIDRFRKLDHAFGHSTAERIEQEINQEQLQPC